jgi:hypothetical protein
MFTIFSTPKPFAGHIDVIQRNAIRSWQCLHPDIEIFLVGDDAGAAETCKEFGIRHIKDVGRNRYGTKYLASIYDQVQERASHEILCHVNCDIILMSDFVRTANQVAARLNRFLMAGRRWDVDIRNPLDFTKADWERGVRELAWRTNRRRPAQWIDYFLFRKNLYYQKIPEFVIGRPGWDNWLLWYPLSLQVPVVDASREVVAVHQNHDYSYHPGGEQGVWHGEEARQNYQLHQGKFATLADATHVMRGGALQRNYQAWLAPLGRHAAAEWSRIWFALLDATRSLRHRVGLRSRAARR